MKLFDAFSRKSQPDNGGQPDYPDLVKAIWRDDLKQLKKLAKSPDVVDPDGRTALMATAIDSKVEAAEILVAAGANVELQDPKGWSALHFAAQSCSVEIARLLLDAGAPVDPVDSYGNTPLWRATFGCRGKGDVIELLRARGADPKMANNSEVSPVNLARTIANFDVAQFFDDVDE